MLLDFDQAYQAVLDSTIPEIGSERINFSNSLNRVLSQDLYAKEDNPLCAKSSMDGYAFHSDDISLLLSAGLPISGRVLAGKVQKTLQKGCAVKIFTGALMPKNSDSILIVENAKIKDGRLFLEDGAPLPQAGSFIRVQGENYKKGECLLHRGDRIGAFEIALLSELNANFISVYQKPTVGILVSGDEVMEVGEARKNPAQVRNANQHLLSALSEQMGAKPISCGIVKDNFRALESNFLEMLEFGDLVVTSGGMSAGDFDFLQEVIKKHVRVIFHKINVKPGKPTLFALSKNNKPILGLPGNPNACGIMFQLFGGAILSKFFNQPARIGYHKAILDTPIRRSDSRLEFRACHLNVKDGFYHVSEMGKKPAGSAIINNLCAKSALVILEANGRDLDAGVHVDVILL